MIFFKNILITWQINNIQQKIKHYLKKGEDIKPLRAEIAKLNRMKCK